MAGKKKDQKTKSKINHYLFILDKSGSMASVEGETISGFNEHVQAFKDATRKYPDQEFYVSLVMFNQDVDIINMNVAAEKLEEITDKQYSADGLTALYDAIGLSVGKLKKEIKDDLENNDTKVFVTIFTDGLENTSKEFNREQVAELVEKLEKDKQWTFNYIGAEHDVLKAGQQMSLGADKISRYDRTSIGTKSAFMSMSDTVGKVAQMRSVSVDDTSLDYGPTVKNMFDESYKKAMEEPEDSADNTTVDDTTVVGKTDKESKD